jgi:hypothetical protein
VNSDAAVKLTTKAFAELKAHPEIGRAEALRRSMVALIEQGEPDEAHPAYWAPFVVVGEGAAGIAATPTSAPVAASAPMPAAEPASAVVPTPSKPATVEPPTTTATKKKATTARPRPNTKAVDWKKSIFER